MKKYFYTSFILLTIAAIAFIIMSAKKKEAVVPELKDRNIKIGLQSEWLNTKDAVAGLLEKLRANPDDQKARLQLAMAYIQEGRITGDHAYYDEASLKLLQQLLEKEPQNFDALCCKATVQLSQHHFQDGKNTAETAVKINPNSAFVYGILCDANLELGYYDEAIKMADKMNATRPDARSYARVSYIREILGDYKGSIEAMKLAASSGYPGLEQSEWTRCQLGKLYETVGDTAKAMQQYSTSLAYRENYPYALAGLGRVSKQKKDYKNAISYFEKAQTMITDYALGDELTNLYLLNGENEKSAQNAQKVVLQLQEHANTDDGNPDKGHYADKELAYSFLKINKPDQALECALREYNRRPENIEANETLAWCYFQKNNVPDAVKYMDKALRYNSLNPILLERAVAIYEKNGDAKKVESLKKYL